MLAEERAITQDTETRHLVHTWQDTDVLESVDDKSLRTLCYRLHVCPTHCACAAPVWNQHLVNISKRGNGAKSTETILDFLKKGHV